MLQPGERVLPLQPSLGAPSQPHCLEWLQANIYGLLDAHTVKCLIGFSPKGRYHCSHFIDEVKGDAQGHSHDTVAPPKSFPGRVCALADLRALPPPFCPQSLQKELFSSSLPRSSGTFSISTFPHAFSKAMPSSVPCNLILLGAPTHCKAYPRNTFPRKAASGTIKQGLYPSSGTPHILPGISLTSVLSWFPCQIMRCHARVPADLGSNDSSQ